MPGAESEGGDRPEEMVPGDLGGQGERPGREKRGPLGGGKGPEQGKGRGRRGRGGARGARGGGGEGRPLGFWSPAVGVLISAF